MAIRLKKNSFRNQLVFFYLIFFLIFGLLVFFFQQYREQTYRRENIENSLQRYTEIISEHGLEYAEIINEELRVTIIDSDGTVEYDNEVDTLSGMDNHLNRPEVKLLSQDQVGVSIRYSDTKGVNYYYYVTEWDGKFLRVALPFDSLLKSELSNDTIFLSFFLFVFMLSLGVVIYYSNKFGDGISKLHEFISEAEKGRYVEIDFPDNELGEISKKIADNYNALKESKKNLRRERNRLVENIAISKKLKYEMTGNIAHELKTPVATISGYIETLLTNKVAPEKSKQFLGRCNEQVIRLTELINDISLVTKIEEAPSMFVKEPINLYDIFSEVTYDLNKGISSVDDVVENLLPEDMFIQGNKNLIYSVFRNLIENSIRYAGRGVIITLSVISENDEEVRISYSDNGVGVSAEHYSRLFERFYRVDYGRARNDGGSGLGLSIVKNAVDIHNGEVSVHTAKDGGLEFKITLAKR